jgi:ribosomal protein S18 acetylase RimI-like enzyme
VAEAAHSGIEVAPADPHSAEAQVLLQELVNYLSTLYPPETLGPLTPGETDRDGGCFVLARLEGRAVGCGAMRPLTAGVSEIKRVYVRTDCRGRGLARRIVAALESEARTHGLKAMRLETGVLQPEAIALYKKLGYGRIPCFGEYAGDPNSLCYEKRLD